MEINAEKSESMTVVVGRSSGGSIVGELMERKFDI